MLRETGAHVEYCDPFFPVARHTRKHGDLQLRSIALSAESFAEFDALVIATAHEQFKKGELYEHTKLVIDTRNLIASLFGETPPIPTVKA